MQSQTKSIIHVRRRSGRRMRVVGVTRTTVTALAAAALVAGSALVGPPAQAAVPPISGVRIEYATPNSFVVLLNSLGAGWQYKVYASTNKPDIYYDNMLGAPRKSSYAKTPRIGIGGFTYTTKPVYYRVQGVKGAARRTSDIFSVGLKPGTPSGVAAATVKGAISLSWGGQAASGAQVQHATNSAFTAGLKTYRIRGTGRQLTPWGMPAGKRHYFRVRSLNVNTPSGWSSAVTGTPSGRRQDVRTMSFNLLTLTADGTKAAGGTISPWSQRRVAAASYINRVKPHVIGIQEGASWTGAVRGDRQVDDLVKAAGSGTWGLARTEVPPSQPGYFRIGIYILYNKALYTPVGNGGSWDIGKIPEGGSRYAVYQVLRHRSTGAQFLFVSTHLYTPGGTKGDQLRQQQTETLISKATSHARGVGNLPIVYAGDYNSHELHPLDGPAVAMNKAKIADGFWVAQQLGNAQYNSANQYYRTPPAFSDNVDHIYASPGVAMRAWSQVLVLSGGKFAGTIPSDHNPLLCDVTIPY